VTTWQAMNALEGLGYRFGLAGAGVRATLQGAPPPGASALLEIVRRDREAARAYIEERQAGATVADDGCTYSILDALAIAQAVKKGEARLLGKVIFRRKDMAVTVHWEPVGGEASAALLLRRRERLMEALKARLRAMEGSEYWNLTAEEYDRFCARYGRYCRLLEGEHDEQQA